MFDYLGWLSNYVHLHISIEVLCENLERFRSASNHLPDLQFLEIESEGHWILLASAAPNKLGILCLEELGYQPRQPNCDPVCTSTLTSYQSRPWASLDPPQVFLLQYWGEWLRGHLHREELFDSNKPDNLILPSLVWKSKHSTYVPFDTSNWPFD